MHLLNFITEQIQDAVLKDELKTIHPKQLICNEDIIFDIYKINDNLNWMR